MKRGGRIKWMATTLVALLAMAGVQQAFSAWNISALGIYDTTVSKGSDRAVAYLNGSYYTTVERAVRDANSAGGGTVYVLPNVGTETNPIVISNDVTLNSGVTLSLPYASSGTDSSISFTTLTRETASGVVSNLFADSTVAKARSNRKSEVALAEGKTLTISSGASLEVGGYISGYSANSNAVTGQTAGEYAQLSLMSGAKINCLGSMTVYGYIKPYSEAIDDSCLVTVGNGSSSGAKLTMPIVMYDWIGGSEALAGTAGNSDVFDWNGSLWSGVFPIETYDFPNVSVPFRAYGDSTVETLFDFYFTGSHSTGSMNLLGTSNAVLIPGSNSSYISVDYDPAFYYTVNGRQIGLTINDMKYLRDNTNSLSGATVNGDEPAARTKLDINGNFSTGDVAITVVVSSLGEKTIRTEGGTIGLTVLGQEVGFDYPRLTFPFSYKYRIITSNGTLTFNTNNKILPGCEVTIGQGSTARVSSGRSVAFLSGCSSNPTTQFYPSRYDSSNLINNGNIVVESGSSFGGYVKTEVTGSTLSAASGANFSVGVCSNAWRTTGGDGKYDFNPRTFAATMDAVNEFTSFSNSTITAGNYESIAIGSAAGYGTRTGTATILGSNALSTTNETMMTISDSGSHLVGDSFEWSVSPSTVARLVSSSGVNAYFIGENEGEATITCNVRYQGSLIGTYTKDVNVSVPRWDVEVSVTTNGLGVTSSVSNDITNVAMGGIGDYVDVTFVVNQNCTNVSHSITWDESVLPGVLDESRSSADIRVYRFTSKAATSGTPITFNFDSDEFPNQSKQVMSFTVANNKRIVDITGLTIQSGQSNASLSGNVEQGYTLSIKGSGWSTYKPTLLINTNPSDANGNFAITSGSSYVKASINGNTIAAEATVPALGSENSRTFTITTSNMVNGKPKQFSLFVSAGRG